MVIYMLSSQKEYNIKFEKICNNLGGIFDKKNIEYGAAYFREENESQWFYELKRKYIRLEQINKNGDKEIESKRENLKDLAIYCIMELIRMEDK